MQDTLHKDVMRKIIFLQRWFRAQLQRKEFLEMRQAAILIQVDPQQELFIFFKLNLHTNCMHFLAVKSQEHILHKFSFNFRRCILRSND